MCIRPNVILYLTKSGEFAFYDGSDPDDVHFFTIEQNVKQIYSSSRNMVRENYTLALKEDGTLFYGPAPTKEGWQPNMLPDVSNILHAEVVQSENDTCILYQTQSKAEFAFTVRPVVAISQVGDYSALNYPEDDPRHRPMPSSIFLGLGADGKMYLLDEEHSYGRASIRTITEVVVLIFTLK